MVMNKIVLSHLLFISLLVNSSSTIADTTKSTATLTIEKVKKYSPLVYLAKNEKFKPSSIEFFSRYVHHSNNYLTSNEEINHPSATNLSFFSGQSVSRDNIPVYVQIVKKPKMGENITDVFYWMFYPYNRGKRVCISPVYLNNSCWGKYSTFGHHVGDWEHITIRFYKETPIKIYLSQHNFGKSYIWGSNKLEYYNSHPIVYSADGSHGSYASSGNFC